MQGANRATLLVFVGAGTPGEMALAVILAMPLETMWGGWGWGEKSDRPWVAARVDLVRSVEHTKIDMEVYGGFLEMGVALHHRIGLSIRNQPFCGSHIFKWYPNRTT